MNTVIATFYHFNQVDNLEDLQQALREYATPRHILGSILLAKEGINGTIAGTRTAIDEMLARLRAIPGFAEMPHKESFLDRPPFKRLKLLVKNEVVAMHEPALNPAETTGVHVSAAEWNQLLDDEDVIVIDTRNEYEIKIGTFKNAVNPHTRHFHQFRQYVEKELDPKQHKKVAMFCTGGVRCEKASAYMLAQGFETVYQLDGGILKYLETVAQEQSYWQGDCFVFDERIAVDHQLQPCDYDVCEDCGQVIAPDEFHSHEQ